MIDPGLTGKVVLITGANNPEGIGAATALAFARQGAKVFLAYLPVANYPEDATVESAAPGRAYYARQQMAPIDPVIAAIRASGGRTEAIAIDLADAAAVPALFARAEATLGPVAVLVNNAAHCVSDTLLPARLLGERTMASSGSVLRPLDAATFDRHFAVNTRAAALCMAAFAGRVVARGAGWGRIINVSTDGADCFPGQASYGASKYALESYSRSAAVELGPLGVTVNVVSLGMVQTGWVTAAMERETAGRYPLRRIGRPDDVAEAIVFLASEQARWITGQTLYVGGGHAMPR